MSTLLNKQAGPIGREVAAYATSTLYDTSVRHPNDGLDTGPGAPTKAFLDAPRAIGPDVNPEVTIDIPIIPIPQEQREWISGVPLVCAVDSKPMAPLEAHDFFSWTNLLYQASCKIITENKKKKRQSGESAPKRGYSDEEVAEEFRDVMVMANKMAWMGVLKAQPSPYGGGRGTKVASFYQADSAQVNAPVTIALVQSILNIFEDNTEMEGGEKAYMILKKVEMKKVNPPRPPEGTISFTGLDFGSLRVEDRCMVALIVTTKSGVPPKATMAQIEHCIRTKTDPPYNCSSYLDFEPVYDSDGKNVKKSDSGEEMMVPVIKSAHVTFLGTTVRKTTRNGTKTFPTGRLTIQTLEDAKKRGKRIDIYKPCTPYELY